MTNEELKNKIVKIIRSVPLWESLSSWYGVTVSVAEKFADALIAEGVTFDKAIAVLVGRMEAKTLIHKAQYYDEMKRRAEVAEKAFSLLYNDCKEKLGWDVDCTMWYKQQAEKEFVEEGGRMICCN